MSRARAALYSAAFIHSSFGYYNILSLSHVKGHVIVSNKAGNASVAIVMQSNHSISRNLRQIFKRSYRVDSNLTMVELHGDLKFAVPKI